MDVEPFRYVNDSIVKGVFLVRCNLSSKRNLHPLLKTIVCYNDVDKKSKLIPLVQQKWILLSKNETLILYICHYQV